MNIVIIGAGKIGATLTEQLLREGHEITVVDTRTAALDAIGNTLDVMTVEGNGISMDTQVEAGVPSADLVIAVMSTDEQNLLSCLIAKRLGVGNTIARVRNPEYTSGLHLIQDDLGMRIDASSILDGMKLSDLGRLQSGALVCVVERGQHEVYIPDGSFTLLAGDRISVVASPKLAAKFFHKIGVQTNPVKRVMLLGGGRISYYLARQMLDFGASVKIIESSAAVCDSLAERLPEATIIHGDGTSEQLLAEEGIAKMDAVASLTGIDEENVLMSLYARSVSSAKIVTKINRTTFSHIIKGMDLGSVFHPRYIAADHIVRYVRAMQNSLGSNVETLYKIVGNKAEALEFRATEKSAVCGRPLMELPTRPNLLIGAINREGRIITPGGRDTIEPGDTVVVVSSTPGLRELDDILAGHRGYGHE